MLMRFHVSMRHAMAVRLRQVLMRLLREEIANELTPLRSMLGERIEAVRSDLQAVRSGLQATRTGLEDNRSDLRAVRSDLDAVRSDLRALRSDLDAVRSDLEAERRSIKIRYRDPLGEQIENAASIAEQLREAVAFAGRDVIVGHNVILWGGRPFVGTGIVLHDGVRLYETCCLAVDHLLPSSGIVAEERVSIGIGCFVDGSGGVRIRRGTIIGPHVTILSSTHRKDVPGPVQKSGKEFKAVDIGEDVWIGSHVVIMMGVTVGNGAVIGAGSIVTRDVPPHSTVVGNPARVIGTTANASAPAPHAQSQDTNAPS